MLPADLCTQMIEAHNLSEEQIESLKTYLADGGWKFNKKTVDIREFLESPFYMNSGDFLYPAILEALEEINSGGYYEALRSGQAKRPSHFIPRRSIYIC